MARRSPNADDLRGKPEEGREKSKDSRAPDRAGHNHRSTDMENRLHFFARLLATGALRAAAAADSSDTGD